MRTVVLGPAAELSFRRYLDELPGFEEAYGALTMALVAKTPPGQFDRRRWLEIRPCGAGQAERARDLHLR